MRKRDPDALWFWQVIAGAIIGCLVTFLYFSWPF